MPSYSVQAGHKGTEAACLRLHAFEIPQVVGIEGRLRVQHGEHGARRKGDRAEQQQASLSVRLRMPQVLLHIVCH